LEQNDLLQTSHTNDSENKTENNCYDFNAKPINIIRIYVSKCWNLNSLDACKLKTTTTTNTELNKLGISSTPPTNSPPPPQLKKGEKKELQLTPTAYKHSQRIALHY
jgi:hypothetical protein